MLIIGPLGTLFLADSAANTPSPRPFSRKKPTIFVKIQQKQPKIPPENRRPQRSHYPATAGAGPARQVSNKSATGAKKLDTCRPKHPIWPKNQGRCPEKSHRMAISCTPVI